MQIGHDEDHGAQRPQRAMDHHEPCGHEQRAQLLVLGGRSVGDQPGPDGCQAPVVTPSRAAGGGRRRRGRQRRALDDPRSPDGRLAAGGGAGGGLDSAPARVAHGAPGGGGRRRAPLAVAGVGRGIGADAPGGSPGAVGARGGPGDCGARPRGRRASPARHPRARARASRRCEPDVFPRHGGEGQVRCFAPTSADDRRRHASPPTLTPLDARPPTTFPISTTRSGRRGGASAPGRRRRAPRTRRPTSRSARRSSAACARAGPPGLGYPRLGVAVLSAGSFSVPLP